MKTLSFALALIAIALAGYSVYSAHEERARLEKKFEEKTLALEASIAGVRAERSAAAPAPTGGPEALEEAQSRLAEVERRVGALEAAPRSGRDPEEALTEGAREMVRKLVREEQAAAIRDRKQKRTVEMEEMHAKMEEHFDKAKERQKKRLEDWIKKFSDKAGLTIAQEQGILDSYRWAREEMNRRMKDMMKEGGPVMFGPEEFKKVAKERDGRIRENLSPEQFAQFEKYRAKNPMPEVGFAVSVGSNGKGAAEAIIIETMPPVTKKKEEQPEGQDK